MTKHTFKLSYFNVRSRGEHLRWMLYQSGASFEDHRVTLEEWPNMKANTPFGGLPVLTIDGKDEVAQSLVIGQFLAAELGLAGKDHVEASKVFMLAHGVSDFQESLIAKKLPMLLIPIFGKMDHAAADELWKNELKNNDWLPLCSKYDKFLEKNGGVWFIGDRLSWADLFFAEVADRMQKIGEPGCLDGYPRLKAHVHKILSLPNLKKYLDQRKPLFEKDW